MYGLVIEGVRFMIVENFGKHVLKQVMQMTHLTEKAISTHDQYSENIVPNMIAALCEITGMTPDQAGVLAGRFFVQFLVRHGYGDLMHVMGRRFSDFLKGLDNIHEYFRFSYPKIRPPSFYCSSESADGLVLHYRSRRQGYISYVIGQLAELARVFYKQDIGVKVLKKKEKGKFLFVIIQLSFNNDGLGLDNRLKEKVQNLNEYLPVDTFSFLKMFPFYIAFNKKLDIIMCGHGLHNLMPDIPGQNMTEVFDLQKPCIKFTAEGCLTHENCNFQLESLQPVLKKSQEEITVKINGVTEDTVGVDKAEPDEQPEPENDYDPPYVTLRGPIIYLKSCETFLLLATCVVDGLDAMFRMGLYLNDYGDADCNREIIMASVQKSDHLKNLLINEKQRSQVLTEMTREIATNKKKARQLLTQMMPYEVANTMLKTGKVDHCETFECCSIAFIKIVDFTKYSGQLTAVEIVNILNCLYSLCDEIVDTHGVYKVETIGESYMISAGVPYVDDHETEVLADCCLQMITKIKENDLTFGDKTKQVQVKIGAFTGPCVGGIVGLRAPRYCLFGDTVNCASRMESHNKVPMTIQIGQRTKDRLEKQAPAKFKIKHRGLIAIKGKGEMKAFEVVAKSGRPRYVKHPPKRPVDEEDDYEGLDDILDEEHHRNSVMSRMSINWGDSVEHSRTGSVLSRRNSDSSTHELNSTIADTIAQTASAVLFEKGYQLGEPYEYNKSLSSVSEGVENAKGEKEKKKKEEEKEKEKRDGKEKRKEQEVNSKRRQSKVGLDSEKKAVPAGRVSPPNSPIGGLTSQTPRPTMGEASTIAAEARSVSKIADLEQISTDQLTDRTMENSSEEDILLQNTTKTPSEDTTPRCQSPIPETPQNGEAKMGKGRKTQIRVEGKKVETVELEEVRKILNSQKTKEPSLKEKAVLPSIVNSAVEAKGTKKCRCEELRADPKLKTKVCSIQ